MNSVFPDLLNQVSLPIVSQEVCRQPDWYGDSVTDDMMCAGYAQGGKDTCNVRSCRMDRNVSYVINFGFHLRNYFAMLACMLCCLFHMSLTRIFPLRFGRPLLSFPYNMSSSSILLTTCSSFIIITWPFHIRRFSVIFLDSCTTLIAPVMC